MSSRGKNFRRRSDSSSTAADSVNGDDNPSPSATKASQSQTLASSRPKSHKPPPPPSGPKRLSFVDDDDDDDESGPVSRPLPTRVAPRPRAASAAPAPVAPIHKLNPTKNRAPPPIPSTLQPQAGEYTKERLLELQKNARSLGSSSSSSKPPPPPQQQQKTEPVIVLRGLIRPDATVEKSEDVETTEAKKKDEPGIPDQDTINAIRAKRERLRQSRGPAPDYISLDSGGALATRPGGESSDEEDHDFRGRIALSTAEPASRGVFEPEVEDESEDEEEKRWEEEQFRKGLGKRFEPVEEVSRVRRSSSTSSIVQLPVGTQPSGYLGVPSLQQPVALSGLSLGEPSMTMAQKAEVASQALKENIKKLREGHGRTVTNLVQTDEKLSEALSDITDLEKSLESAGEKYVFMQQLRDFISVICDFLKDKGLLIEELEEEMQKLHEQRAAAVEERRAADGVDESNEVEAAVTAAMSVLNKGSGAVYLSAAANAAQAALVAARESSNLPVQIDEFGRDVNLKKRMDFTRRAEARKRRRARAESNLVSLSSAGKDSSFNQVEGEVTTDESDSESSAYKSTRDELLQTAEQIFSDASDEYSNLSIVKEKFEMWKKQHSSSYRDAYMSLSAPNVFSPYVRLELLKWDPLYNMTDFYDMEWHKLLFDYGLPGEGLDLDPDDPDTNLIPVLVEKVALPILHHEVEHCWDMFSTRRTENAVYATNLVISYVPASSEALAELLKVICKRLTQAIAGLRVPVWRPEVTRVVPGAAQFVAYRFGTSVRLLRNVCMWKDVVSLPVLEKLALEELLSGQLLPHVRSIMSNIHDAITRMERIVASLSGVWYGPKVTADHSQKLKPLIDCVAELGRKLEKRQASGLSEEETVGLARRLKTILVQLNEYDRARAMLRTFHLKEAL